MKSREKKVKIQAPKKIPTYSTTTFEFLVNLGHASTVKEPRRHFLQGSSLRIVPQVPARHLFPKNQGYFRARLQNVPPLSGGTVTSTWRSCTPGMAIFVPNNSLFAGSGVETPPGSRARDAGGRGSLVRTNSSAPLPLRSSSCAIQARRGCAETLPPNIWASQLWQVLQPQWSSAGTCRQLLIDFGGWGEDYCLKNRRGREQWLDHKPSIPLAAGSELDLALPLPLASTLPPGRAGCRPVSGHRRLAITIT